MAPNLRDVVQAAHREAVELPGAAVVVLVVLMAGKS